MVKQPYKETNRDIREYVSKAGVTTRQVAAQMGITIAWYFQLLNTELSDQKRQRFIEAVDALTNKEEA